MLAKDSNSWNCLHPKKSACHLRIQIKIQKSSKAISKGDNNNNNNNNKNNNNNNNKKS